MERRETIKCAARLFTLLIRRTVDNNFRFPGGGVVQTTLGKHADTLCRNYGAVSPERIVDFCVCQVYAISSFGRDYLPRWSVGHSFGDKAMKRYASNSTLARRRENEWLQSYKLSKEVLIYCIADRSKHPLYRFIHPHWEEKTKNRAISTEVGYYICGSSTLLWTPFSPSCQDCVNARKCISRTEKIYPELLRIRMAEFEMREERRDE